jgi:hypothetical protein
LSNTISALAPLKSNRVSSSFYAWLMAFSSSMELTLDTMSKLGMVGSIGQAVALGSRRRRREKPWKHARRAYLARAA